MDTKEILYKIYIFIGDLISPVSATYQKERYRSRYGIPKTSKHFIGQGSHCDFSVLHGEDFYKNLMKMYETPFFKQIKKDIKEKGSFCPSDYGVDM